MSVSTEPEPAVVYEGISYPVALRVTPGRGADGLPADGVMWSADCQVTDGWSLTAAGDSPASALDALTALIRGRKTTRSPR